MASLANPDLSVDALQLLERVGFPNNFPESWHAATVIETHISVVILGPEIVIKLKKAAHFPFVDHRQLASRFASCRNEVLLNRRLSSGIYRGLIAFPLKPGQSIESLVFEPVVALNSNDLEVGVVMTRIPEHCLFDAKLRDETLEPQYISLLAKKLFAFHRNHQIPITDAHEKLFRSAVLENFSTIRESIQQLRNNSSQNTARLLQILSTLDAIELRNAELLQSIPVVMNLIVDGHADLRAEHIALFHDELQVIDCVEFSDSLRHIHPLDDIAFLVMDLSRRGHGDFAAELLQHYVTEYPEAYEQQRLVLFLAYRAVVRAKVNFLKALADGTRDLARESMIPQAVRSLGLALRYFMFGFEPIILVCFGLMGVGKSTLASLLSERFGLPLLQSDAIRSRVYSDSNRDSVEPFGEGKYTMAGRQAVYEALFQEAQTMLRAFRGLVLDASFSNRNQREQVRTLARRFNAQSLFLYCSLDEDLTRQRLRKRLNDPERLSEGREELLRAQQANFDFPEKDEMGVIQLDLASAPEQVFENLLPLLRSQND